MGKSQVRKMAQWIRHRTMEVQVMGETIAAQ